MRATGLGIVIGLTLVLVVAGTGTGQESSARSLEVADPAGDMYDYSTLETFDGPAYMDLTLLSLGGEEEDLVVRFDAAGDIPSDLDPLYTTVGWYLNVDADGDGEVDRWVALDPLDGWSASVFDIATVEDTPVGVPAVIDNTLAIRVPWSLLGSPDEVRFQGLMQSQHFPDPVNDPLTWTDWEDRIPNDESEWLALADATSPTPTALRGPSTSASTRSPRY